MKKAVCLLSLCLLSACGGGGGGSVADPVAVSPSPSAPPPAGAPAPATPDSGTTPTAPPAAAAVLATSYAAADMSCVQGDPGYWQRSWRIGYDGGVFRLQPLPPATSGQAPIQADPARVLAWSPTDVVTTTVAGGSQFAGNSADGRRATLQVAADGTPIGFAIQDAGGQPLRCGSFVVGAALAGPRTANLLCQWVFPSDGPIQAPPDLPAYPATVTLDPRGFPWAGLTVSSDPHLFDDPSGAEVSDSPNRFWSTEADGSVSVYIGPPFSSEGTTYTLRDGQVIGARVNSRAAAGPAQVCAPA